MSVASYDPNGSVRLAVMPPTSASPDPTSDGSRMTLSPRWCACRRMSACRRPPTASCGGRRGTWTSSTSCTASSGPPTTCPCTSATPRVPSTSPPRPCGVGLDHSIFADDFRYLQSVTTSATPKLTIPSPSMVHYRAGGPRSTPPCTPSSTTSGPICPLRTLPRCVPWASWAAPTCSSTTPAWRTSTIPPSARSWRTGATTPSTSTCVTSLRSTPRWRASPTR